jgi:uncharacterized protein with LGFP repeats
MPDDGISFESLESEVARIRATLGDLKAINDQLNTDRTVVCAVINATDLPLSFGAKNLDHGVIVTVEQRIGPRSSAAFGARSSSGGVLVGTEGTVWYDAADGTSFRFHWDNPWSGANGSDSEVTGPLAGLYRTWTVTGGRDHAQMQFVAAQLMPTPFHSIWARLGGATGTLGMPTTECLPAPDGVGCYMHFPDGSIYSSPNSGTHEIHGLIRTKWASLDSEAGMLGYPVTDELAIPRTSGAYSHFEHGSIYWTATTGAHEIHGPIRDKWASLGSENSELGYPVSDVATSGSTHVSHFQHGIITWDSATGDVTAQTTRDIVKTDVQHGVNETLDVTLNRPGKSGDSLV